MNAYEQKLEAKKERYLNRAEKAKAQAAEHEQASSRLVQNIQFGQPILVGHHSEGRHRRTLERSQNLMFKMVDDLKKAEYYEQKAASVGTGGISSDDPEAIQKLQATIAELTAKQEHMKKINNAHRKFMKSGEKALEGLADQEKQLVINYKPAYSWEAHQFAPYQLSNNKANLARYERRLADLQARPESTEPVTKEHGNIKLIEDDNRVQIVFPGKPDDTVRSILKSNSAE